MLDVELTPARKSFSSLAEAVDAMITDPIARSHNAEVGEKVWYYRKDKNMALILTADDPFKKEGVC